MDTKLTIQSKIVLCLLTFGVLVLLHCFIAWCAGYNFDKRSHTVAFFVAQTLFDSVSVSAWPFLFDTKKGD